MKAGFAGGPDWRLGHCAEPAIAAAAAARGISPAAMWARLGGCPRSWREAAALYRRLGVRTLADAATAVLGPPYPAPRLARRGDVAMVRGALGICRGELIECCGSTVPLAEAERAWPAGRG